MTDAETLTNEEIWIVPASDLEDYDDCLAEAVTRVAVREHLERWELVASWDDDRENVIVEFA